MAVEHENNMMGHQPVNAGDEEKSPLGKVLQWHLPLAASAFQTSVMDDFFGKSTVLRSFFMAKNREINTETNHKSLDFRRSVFAAT